MKMESRNIKPRYPGNVSLDRVLNISSKMFESSLDPFAYPFNLEEADIGSNNNNMLLNVSGIIANNTNSTCGEEEMRLEHAPELTSSALVKVYVLSAMAILSLVGNILTMWNIYKTRLARRNSRHSWSAIYSLIFHLSIADVLVTGFCIIGEAAWCYTVEWMANEITCKLVKLFQMFSLYLSTYVLVLIGVDRWIAVKYPMKSLNMAKRCYRLLGGTYVMSFLLSLPQFFIFHVARGPFVEEFYQCVTHGFYTAEWQEQLYTTFTLVFTFLLPLIVLLVTYMSTFRTIANSEKMFQGSRMPSYSNKPTQQTNRQRLIHKAKMKSLRISVVIIIAFLICWTPYNVMMIIFMFLNPDKRVGEDLQSGIFFFGMSNSVVNPLIYGAFHLCPFKRKAKAAGGHANQNSLNRVDSQRNASILTAVTQIDGNGRQIRTYRQSSYYRSPSNGSTNNYLSNGSTYGKEHVGLLEVTNTPTPVRKLPRSPHPKQNIQIFGSSSLSANYLRTKSPIHEASNSFSLSPNNAASSSCSTFAYPPQKTILLSYNSQRAHGTDLTTITSFRADSICGIASNAPSKGSSTHLEPKLSQFQLLRANAKANALNVNIFVGNDENISSV